MYDLCNKLVISTQPEESFPDFAKAIKGFDLSASNFPMIDIVEAVITKQQETLIKDIRQFQWLVFTSKNGIQYFFQKLEKITGSAVLPSGVKTAVIGEKTGSELLKYEIKPDYISKSNLAEIFACELRDSIIKKGSNVLLLLGNLASDTIQNTFQNHANVKRIDCYETTKPQKEDLYHINIIASGKYDLIIFTSSSAFHNFAEIIKKYSIDIKKIKVASIGKSTSATMSEYGVEPVFTAKKSNMDGIVEEIMSLL